MILQKIHVAVANEISFIYLLANYFFYLILKKRITHKNFTIRNACKNVEILLSFLA